MFRHKSQTPEFTTKLCSHSIETAIRHQLKGPQGVSHADAAAEQRARARAARARLILRNRLTSLIEFLNWASSTLLEGQPIAMISPDARAHTSGRARDQHDSGAAHTIGARRNPWSRRNRSPWKITPGRAAKRRRDIQRGNMVQGADSHGHARAAVAPTPNTAQSGRRPAPSSWEDPLCAVRTFVIARPGRSGSAATAPNKYHTGWTAQMCSSA